MVKHSKKYRRHNSSFIKNTRNTFSKLTNPITGNAEKTFNFVANKSSPVTKNATGLLNNTIGTVMNTITKTGKRHHTRRHKTRRYRR